jgi:hypothetical protein
VSGHTPEFGDVTIKDESREEQIEKSFGVYKDRVGYYRLWKDSDGTLRFHHFWKSGITTQSVFKAGPEEYYLGYDTRSLEPLYLGLLQRKILLRFWLWKKIEISREYLEPIYGTMPRLRGIQLTVYG